MEMYDPERPQINHQPAYGNPPIAVLPYLMMNPKSHGLTLVSVMLSNGGNSFSLRQRYEGTAMIPNVLSRYHKDPEKFLLEFFDYKIPDKSTNEQRLRELCPSEEKQTLRQNVKPTTKNQSIFSIDDL